MATTEPESAAIRRVLDPLAGVELPPVPRGRASRELRRQWLQVCEFAMARGVRRPGTLARMTGLTPRTAKRWMAEVEAGWKQGMAEDERNVRREQLYREADAIARQAWQIVLDGKHPGWVIGALRVVLEANKRRARLCGMDGHQIDLTQDLQSISMLEAGKGGPLDLAEAGSMLAQQLSSPTTEPAA